MKPSEAKSLLTTAFQKKRKLLLVGEPGIGKTDIIVDAAAAAGCDVKITHPAVSDPTDYKGMPCIVQNGQAHAEFLPFGDLRDLIEAKRPTVCFMDDIGQAPHSVQAALMQLLLARQVNGHKISDHVVFVGATNDSSHRAGVNALLEPVKSRFDSIIHLEVSFDDWMRWAYENDMPVELIGYLNFRKEMLHKFEPSREMKNSPSPRTVAAAGRWLNDGVQSTEVIAGCVGEGFAAEFEGFMRIYRTLPNLDEIIKRPNAGTVPTDPATIYAVVSSLNRMATKENVGSIMTYFARLADEFHLCAVNDLERGQKWFQGTREFVVWASKYSKWME